MSVLCSGEEGEISSKVDNTVIFINTVVRPIAHTCYLFIFHFAILRFLSDKQYELSFSVVEYELISLIL